MEGRRLIFVLVAAAGLVLYLWPALRAPVVLWSDSRLDMAWAEQGIGLWSPFPATAREVHPIKPGYLLFLRGAMGAFPWAGKERSAVIVQSFLLWASILGSSLLLARRRGSAAGLMSCAVLFSLLRLRDSASAVMSEPLAAALFLPLGVIALDPPARRRSIPVAALAVVVLFQVRPNVGGMALLLLLAGWSVRKSWRQALLMTILVGGGVVLCWVATRPEGSQAVRPPGSFYSGAPNTTGRPRWGPGPRRNQTGSRPRVSDGLRATGLALSTSPPRIARESFAGELFMVSSVSSITTRAGRLFTGRLKRSKEPSASLSCWRRLPAPLPRAAAMASSSPAPDPSCCTSYCKTSFSAPVRGSSCRSCPFSS